MNSRCIFDLFTSPINCMLKMAEYWTIFGSNLKVLRRFCLTTKEAQAETPPLMFDIIGRLQFLVWLSQAKSNLQVLIVSA